MFGMIFRVLAAMAVATNLVAGELDKRLTFYADFDQGTTAQIAKGDARSVVDENLKYVEGKYGRAAHFGDGLLEYAYAGNVSGDGAWSLCLWFKLDETPGDHTLFRMWSGGWRQGDLYAAISKWGHLDFVAFDADKAYRETFISSDNFKAGEWNHLVFTYDQGKKTILLNGYPCRYLKNDPVAVPGPTARQIRLGHMNGNDTPLRGALDELKIYDIALTPAQAREAMRQGGAQPAFLAPLSADATAKNFDTSIDAANQVRLTFVPGGALLMRLGYDARSVLTYSNIAGILGDTLTANFTVTPKWGGLDVETHGFLAARSEDGKSSWSIAKGSDGKLHFTVNPGGSIAAAIAWKAEVAYSVTASYDLPRGRMSLAVDGKTIASGALERRAGGGLATLFVGDTAEGDTYSKTQANAVMGNVAIFDRVLAPDDIAARLGGQNSSADEPLKLEAVTATEQPLWDLKGAFSRNTGTRAAVCLNALWRFQPVEPGRLPAPGKWRYLAVPGRYSGDANNASDHQFFVRGADLKPLGKDFKWEGKSLYGFREAWLERAFTLDSSWRERGAYLEFEELSPSESGVIYLNGQRLATLGSALNNVIPLKPGLLRFDGPNFLSVKLKDTGDCWAWRGVKGDVWLKSRPALALEAPRVATSVRNHELTVKATVVNRSAADAELRLSCAIAGKDAPADLHGDLVTVKAGQSQELELSVTWRHPELWDFEHPYLYEIAVSVLDKDGKELDRLPPFKFGFREFWIDGGDYVLNGRRVHLSTFDEWCNTTIDPVWNRQFVKTLKEMGFNSLRSPFSAKDRHMPNLVKACDEEGLLLFMYAGGVDRGSFATWDNPETRRKVEAYIASTVAAWGNHPSIVMWYLSTNQLGYGWDYHPLKQADGYLPDFDAAFAKACLEGAEMLNQRDGTRPYFMQAGGGHGPVHNANAYFCWWPLAERMEWPEEWSKRKLKPLHIIETSFPYWASWFGMDLEYPQAKPYLLPENAARYYGQEAYRLVDPMARPYLDEPNIYRDLPNEVLSQERRVIPLVYKLKADMFANTVEAWRGAGMSGICSFAELPYAFGRKSPAFSRHVAYEAAANPTEFRAPGWKPDILKYAPASDIDITKPTPFNPVLKAALSPTLVYIGGDADRPTNKDHSYYVGEKVRKDIVAINDTLEEKDFKLECRAVADSGAVLASEEFAFTLEPGAMKKCHFSFRATESGKIEVGSARPFAFQVYPKRQAPAVSGVALHDSRGLTADMLDHADIDYKNFDHLESLDSVRLVVVGRQSLDAAFFAAAKRLKLDTAVVAGKTNVLVFEQDDLAALGLDTYPVYSREVFPGGDKPSPVLDGIPTAGLSWWRGDGTLAPNQPEPAPETANVMKSPFWHWSNRNLTVSYPIRRPSAGDYRCHLVTGMDLVYSPLLEFRQGQGKIVFCQMEVTARSEDDPAALALFDNLLRYCDAPNSQAKPGKLCALGTDGFGFSGGATLDATAALVNLHGPALARALPELEKFAADGKTVVFMPLTKNDLEKVFKLKAEPVTLGSYELPGLGLDARDRFLRVPVKVTAVAGTAPLTEVKKGQGRFLFAQLDPAYFDDSMTKEEKVGFNSSNLWAYGIEKEHILQFWGALLSSLNLESSTALAARLVNPLSSTTQDLKGDWAFAFDPDNSGAAKGWATKDFDASAWKKTTVPDRWTAEGSAWYRKTVELAPGLAGTALRFRATGGLDDLDWVYVDGELVGHTGEDTQGYWMAPRSYHVPAALTAGKTSVTIAIRLQNLRGGAGINPGELDLGPNSQRDGAFPYYRYPLPSYNTERHIRW